MRKLVATGGLDEEDEDEDSFEEICLTSVHHE